jgi:hypothetical protein
VQPWSAYWLAIPSMMKILNFRDNLEDEELLARAEELGLGAFEKWKRWHRQERHIQQLRANKKVTLK